VVDALVAYEWQTWRFALNVDNAFDKDYVDASRFANTLQPGYGRNVKFSVAYRF
jgi:outer membrane receptor protein involved in Fe transport